MTITSEESQENREFEKIKCFTVFTFLSFGCYLLIRANIT